MKKDFTSKANYMLNNLDGLHKVFYSSFNKNSTFRGPSLYFHEKALNLDNSNMSFEKRIEYIYATLTSWGMHRMGKSGGKMVMFDVFSKSIENIKDTIIYMQSYDPLDRNDDYWHELKHIFVSIEVMQTNTKLVGNSKVMCHLIPNLIPPIDRQYTLNYLYGNTNINTNKDNEWKKLHEILNGFFYEILKNKEFDSKASEWVKNPEQRWDTSKLKVIDNLVIATGLIDGTQS